MTHIRLDITTQAKSLSRVLTDAELGRKNRLRLPMVFWFEETSIEITKEWQNYLLYINPGMDRNHVAELLGDSLAFCNGSGFGDPTEPRRDFIRGENLQKNSRGEYIYPNPKFSKVFTCGGNIVENNNGVISLMDGNKYPDITITPQTNPELFYAVYTTGDDGTPHPFPNGALYNWYKNGKTPVSFLPHVRNGGSFLFNPLIIQENTVKLVPLE